MPESKNRNIDKEKTESPTERPKKETKMRFDEQNAKQPGERIPFSKARAPLSQDPAIEQEGQAF